MAIDREFLMKQMEQASKRGGPLRYLKKGTTNLRIVTFIDEADREIFARQVTEHIDAERKSVGTCLADTYGEPCAFCRANEVANEQIYPKKRKWVVNAVNVDAKKPTMDLWSLPTTAFEAVASFAVSDDWSDIMDLTEGLPIAITREGEGLDTDYTVVPKRKPYPLTQELVDEITDPLIKLPKETLEDQCKTIGVAVEELFPDGVELAPVASDVSVSDGAEEQPAEEEAPAEEIPDEQAQADAEAEAQAQEQAEAEAAAQAEAEEAAKAAAKKKLAASAAAKTAAKPTLSRPGAGAVASKATPAAAKPAVKPAVAAKPLVKPTGKGPAPAAKPLSRPGASVKPAVAAKPAAGGAKPGLNKLVSGLMKRR